MAKVSQFSQESQNTSFIIIRTEREDFLDFPCSDFQAFPGFVLNA